MPYKKIKRESYATQVYDILKQDIMNGVYLPGDKISEQTVADSLDLSRSPVREAIRQLANEGLIDYFPNRGAFVKVYMEKNIRDSFAVRLLLEQYAVENIVPELREQYMDEMSALLERIKLADRTENAELDTQVHELIIKLSGNDTLLTFYRLLYTQISAFREISLIDDGMFALSCRSHTELLKSVMEGKDERAKRIIIKHLNESQQEVQQYYKEKTSRTS